METLIAVLVSPATAEEAIAELLKIPVPQEAITFVTADPELATQGDGKSLGACLGGIFGSAAGLLLGATAATMLVPGVGPVLAMGLGAAALLGLGGAGAGAALGASVPQSPQNPPAVTLCATPAEAQFFRNVLKNGRSLVMVRTESKPVAEAAGAVLDRLGIGTPRNVDATGSAKATVREFNGVSVVDLCGRIALGDGGGMLRDTVHKLVKQGHKKIMLNFRRVTHIDSSGVGELVRALMAVRSHGGDLKLVNVSLPVNEILGITRLRTLFDVAEDETTGAASFRALA